MKFCPNCKSLANDTEETCEVCGNKLELITTTLKHDNKIQDKAINNTKVINNKNQIEDTSKISKSDKALNRIKYIRITIFILIILIIIAIIVLFLINKYNKKISDISKFSIEMKDDNITKVEYTEYKNNRFEFSISIPQIFDNVYEADNGDGITCSNNNDNLSLIIYSYNNIMNESAKDGYYDIKNNINKNINIVSSDLEDRYFSIIYDDDKFEYFNYKQYYNNSVYTISYIYPKEDREYYSNLSKNICKSFKIINTNENY